MNETTDETINDEQPKAKKKYYDYISVGNRTKQEVYFVEPHDKTTMFELFYKEEPLKSTVVLTKSKRSADELTAFLKTKNINAITIHGNHRKEQIEKAALAFNSGEVDILITTDKIFDLLELKDIKTVLNYELPFEPESYFKTLRYVDEIGQSISFVSSQDEKMLDILEYMMKYDIPQLEIDAFKHTALPKKDFKKDKVKKPRHKKQRKQKKEINERD